MPDKLSINQWAEEDRPREKLMRIGAENLSNAELLAILIGSGSAKQSAVDLMKDILNDCNNNLNTLGKMGIHELERYNGMGPAKAVTLLAACELGKRRHATRAEDRPLINSAEAVYDLMHGKLQDLDAEEAWGLYLNQGLRLIKAVRLSHGGISETAVDVRILIKEALLCNATAIAFCHNHPSGQCRPSGNDDRLTDRIKKAAEVMRLHLLDHVIVTDGDYYSYNDQGKL